MINGIKFIVSAGLVSLLTTSVFAQDIQPLENQGNLITVCKDEKSNKVCETKKNSKLLRKISYSKGILSDVDIYYLSGRLAKSIIPYNADGKLDLLVIYPDKDKEAPDYKRDEYWMMFENGKFFSISNQEYSSQHGLKIPTFDRYCKEDTPNGKKCDEMNYFYPSPEPDLHPAFALPIENQGLDVLKSNGIKMP